MDILFINPQDALQLKKEVNGQLILGTLLLQAGFDVDILRFCQIDEFKANYELFIQNLVNRILSYNPKVVSFYSLWPDYHIMLRIAKELKDKRPDIYTVFGGPQPSATAIDTMNAMPYVDFICSGEGENTVVPFFTALLRNNCIGFDSIPGLYYREDGAVVHNDLPHPLCDLNTLPYWDDRLYLRHYTDSHENYSSIKYYMPIDVGRGCPFSCTFCNSSTFWKRTYRLKTPEKIVSDINYYKEKFGINNFFFSHDAFTVNKKLVTEICNLFVTNNMNIHWKCTSRIDCIDIELIDTMAKAGLKVLELGIESGSDKIQKSINKKLDLSNVIELVKEITKRKIKVMCFFMHGFPDETEEDLELTLNLQLDLIESGVKKESMTLCRFVPGSKMTNQHIDNLIFDSTVPELAFRSFGTYNELSSITKHPKIFSYLYHLKTDVREKYQYLHYFIEACMNYPVTIKHLRSIFKKDIIFYKNFESSNKILISENFKNLSQLTSTKPYLLLQNIINNCKYSTLLNEILRFEADKIMFALQNKNIEEIITYNFVYQDYKEDKQIDKYHTGKTIVLFKVIKENLNFVILHSSIP